MLGVASTWIVGTNENDARETDTDETFNRT